MDTIQGEAIDVLGPIGAMAQAERARRAEQARQTVQAGGTLEQRVTAAHQAARQRDGAWQLVDGRLARLRLDLARFRGDAAGTTAVLQEAEAMFAAVRDASEAELPGLLFGPPPAPVPLTGAQRLAIAEGHGLRLSVAWDGSLHVSPASKLTPRLIEEIRDSRDAIVAELVRRADVFVVPAGKGSADQVAEPA